ncbi:hypothetical protein F3Y22_tig00002889pilonHSYRG00015 [Hibiscus syriacus]|uniref:SHSP domain-containing protein n=1 Tax=Hibiscus syriacus TaxID=106335 RepID=A0A6A3CMP1_HIBSY|nr:inactive protein RESTRICTED TEV MOVEMENT 2-like [Hibiscus syriacus]XP_039028354.1 inactive protein RESTRICTED TEV MOVEMENT 2-like [Hibiscus syriacus]KAE8730725.1 hypothetical protein F3Y22_tig00002889pilonHSYRG00011 [Hibiscus syriacus]KAE8730728.1 hypothetical protein F3Y22_tig00002889pilonHSYRG00015 [Hibiscus syriacus]
MSNARDRLSQRWPSHIAEKFVPTSYWTEDSEGNYLLDIDLPGFEHDEVRIEQESAGYIKVEGERIPDENRCIYIDQTFRLPENSDTENILGNFDGQHLCITVPKKIIRNTVDQSSHKKEEDRENDRDRRDIETKNEREEGIKSSSDRTCCVPSSKKPEGKYSLLSVILDGVERNKGIVLSACISFAIGVWVSQLWV